MYTFEGTIITDCEELEYDNIEEYNDIIKYLLDSGIEFEAFTQSQYCNCEECENEPEVEVELSQEDIQFIKELRENFTNLESKFGKEIDKLYKSLMRAQ